MKTLVKVVALVCLIGASLAAASLPAMFWTAVVQNCLAQAADGGSTALAISAGAHEINPLAVHTSGPHDGQLNMPRLIAFKALGCGLPIAIRYAARIKVGGDLQLITDRTGYVAGASLAGTLGSVTETIAIHNLKVWTAQKALDAAAAEARSK